MKIIYCRKMIAAVPVQGKVLNYSGSIGFGPKLLQKSGMIPGEKIKVFNRSNGATFETYIIKEKKQTKGVYLYGPAARLGEVGDLLDLMVFAIGKPKKNSG